MADYSENESIRVVRIQQIQGKKHRLRVSLEGEEDFVIYPKEARLFQLTEGGQILRSEYHRLLNEILIPRAKKRVFYLLERQDRTAAGLMEKLISSGYPYSVAEKAVLYARELGYVDDERYARTYVCFHKESMSYRRIAMQLARRGVDRELAGRILEEEYDADEEELIAGLLEKRHYNPEIADTKAKAKMYRYLVSRGFSAGKARKYL